VLPVAAPTTAKYIGADAGSPTVQYNNFRIRYNQATLNVEIATVAGTETIGAFCESQFGGALFNVNQVYNVTTTFQVFGDPGVIDGAERRSYRFGPTSLTDSRHYDFEMQHITATKIAMKIQEL
jgi:hypothetical protein